MAEQSQHTDSLGERLLREERLDKSEYEEYRMNLETALTRALRMEKITFHVCWGALVLAMILMFVGGSQIVGAFDPFDNNANALSVTLGVVFVIANIVWPLSLASVYSRLRPRIRFVKDEIHDAKIEALQFEVTKLREELSKRTK